MKIIVGLGNPGKEYIKTRHNAGFLVLDAIASQHNLKFTENKKFNALIAKNQDLLLVKPLTFMNNSGQSVQSVLSFYKLIPKKLGLFKEKNSDLSEVLTIIHDDLDIPGGKYKLSIDSRAAGHNGVQSVINHLKTKNFTRIRVGIKPAEDRKVDIKKYVLKNFSSNELSQNSDAIKEIIQNIQ